MSGEIITRTLEAALRQAMRDAPHTESCQFAAGAGLDTCSCWKDDAIRALAAVPDPLEEVEQLRIQLAGCLTAAEGSTQDVAVPDDYGWSLAYQAVLDLRVRYDQEQEAVAEAREVVARLNPWTGYDDFGRRRTMWILMEDDCLALRRALGMKE